MDGGCPADPAVGEGNIVWDSQLQDMVREGVLLQDMVREGVQLQDMVRSKYNIG